MTIPRINEFSQVSSVTNDCDLQTYVFSIIVHLAQAIVYKPKC